MTLHARFAAKYIPEPNSGCWLWIGAVNGGSERPQIWCEDKIQYAARVSWKLHKEEPIPDGLLVLHSCDNGWCVNPDHLFLGTDLTNALDREAKGRGHQVRGEAHCRAKLTAQIVLEIWQLRGHVSERKLALAYDVTRAAISNIHRGKSWGWLTDGS